MTLFSDLVLAVKNTPAWTNDIKPGILAWAIKEQGENRHLILGGMGELARFADNYFSLHQRKEMVEHYPRTYHLISTTEKDNNYIIFTGPEQCLEGLVEFLHRPKYQEKGSVDDHMTSIEDLLRHVTPAFCPQKGYVESVLSFVPEAEAELRKVGWKPDVVEPAPELTVYSVVNGVLMGPDVNWGWVSNHDFYPRAQTLIGVIHGTACLKGKGQRWPGILESGEWNNPKNVKKQSAHLVFMRDGSIWQAVNLNLPAWHCYGHNANSIGIEFENIGPFEKWQEVFGWFFRFKGKPWEQKIAKKELVLLTSPFSSAKYYQLYTVAQLEKFRAVYPALRIAYPRMKGLVGHNQLNKVDDPWPTFPWPQILS